MAERAGAVAVTGFGVLSCFGFGAEPIRRNVFAGIPGFRTVERFDTGFCRVHRAACSDYSGSLSDAFERTASEALTMAGLTDPAAAAVLLGTQGDWTGLTAFWRGERPDAAPAAIAGSHAELLGRRLGIAAGQRRVFNNGCIAASTAIGQGMGLLTRGAADLVLAGGGYLVEPEFYAKFDSGRAFTEQPLIRPFSKDRSGLLLGDGAAVLALERLDDVRRRGGTPLAILAGAGLSADSYHVCRPHPNGVGLAHAIRAALEQAGLQPGDVDYINAHGTGTPANDSAECAGLESVFGSVTPPVSSTKGCTGHALEGSGALEAVICLLALADGCLPPTAGFTTADPDCAVDCVPNQPRQQPLKVALSCSAAFGGANAALILSAA